MDPTWLWLLLSGVLMAVGLVGLVLPAIPGSGFILAGIVLAAWAEDFVHVGRGTLIAVAVLAALTYAVDFAAGALGAKHFGASRRAVVGAAIGAVVGLFMGLVGILVGPFVGAVVGEWTLRRELHSAGRAGIGTALGLAVGVAANLALGLSMVGLFVLARFF